MALVSSWLRLWCVMINILRKYSVLTPNSNVKIAAANFRAVGYVIRWTKVRIFKEPLSKPILVRSALSGLIVESLASLVDSFVCTNLFISSENVFTIVGFSDRNIFAGCGDVYGVFLRLVCRKCQWYCQWNWPNHSNRKCVIVYDGT